MKQETIDRLLNINREFYQSFADPFRATRGRLQPGVVRILEQIQSDVKLLDLGCAHGVFAEALMERGFSGRYVGIDSSHSLLDSIPKALQPPQYQFGLADLSQADWMENVRSISSVGAGLDQAEKWSHNPFDWVLAFAVLHHIPTVKMRRAIATAIGALLNVEARVAISVWDFLASPRLQDRIVPWESVDLEAKDVDEGDYLVDWREGGRGVRYVHHFSEAELRALAQETGFHVTEQYRSDGENGQLGIYQIWVAGAEG